MKTRIVRIGNSQGILIPKLLLQHSNLSDQVELEAEHDRIIIRSAKKRREGWGADFRAMSNRGDDSLTDKAPLIQTTCDKTEWEW